MDFVGVKDCISEVAVWASLVLKCVGSDGGNDTVAESAADCCEACGVPPVDVCDCWDCDSCSKRVGVCCGWDIICCSWVILDIFAGRRPPRGYLFRGPNWLCFSQKESQIHVCLHAEFPFKLALLVHV